MRSKSAKSSASILIFKGNCLYWCSRNIIDGSLRIVLLNLQQPYKHRLYKRQRFKRQKQYKFLQIEHITNNYRRVAEFHMRLTFWENLPHRHKGWNRSQIKTKCLYFYFDWVVRTKIGSVISKKGEITLSLKKKELGSTNFESIFCSVKTLFFRKLFYFLKSI